MRRIRKPVKHEGLSDTEGGDFWLNELNEIPDAKTDVNVQKFRPS